MDKNIIICGDTIEEMKKLPTSCMDLIFADPPYWMRTTGVLNRVEGTEYDGCNDKWDNQFETNADYNAFTKEWLSECQRLLKPNGSIWVIGSMQCIYSIGSVMQDLGFWFINDVIWQKKNPTPNFKGTRLNNSHETLIWATKSQKSKFTFNYKTAKELNTDTVSDDEFCKGTRKQLGSVWRIGICQGNERLKKDDGTKLHSTQKPEDLLRRVITISSKVGDLVFDPFGGTMTTAAVAKKMGRQYLTIEREKEYCDYGRRRLDEAIVSIGDIENAVYDIKPKRVKLEEMIVAKYFKVNEEFFLKNNTPCGKLTSDGKLNMGGEILDIHTAAARAKGRKADRLNGFDVWCVKRDGELVGIDRVREEFRSTI
ncbi:MAG: site-specific DNA-methyltransferase [Oscillospiraceae bacterium]